MTSSVLPGSDAELVQLALQGQQDAFGELYNRYFTSVHDFLSRMMKNSEEAADVTQETFVRAMERLGGLKKAASFKSWLFSIAHNQALNRLERAQRIVDTPAAKDSEETFDPLLHQIDPDRLADPAQAAEANELAGLVWEAAAGLEPRQYAVLDLHVRQGLESAEIAEVLGVSKGNAYTMLNRMKQAVGDAIGTFLVARRGSKDCDELQRILAPVEIPPITPELRRTIDRHVKGCDVCTRTRRRIASPVEILGAFAAAPVPVGLQQEIWSTIEPRWAEAAASLDEAGADGPPAGSDGGGWWGLFGSSWGTRRFALLGGGFALLAVTMLVIAFSANWLASGGSPSAAIVTPTTTSVPATATPTPAVTPAPTATPTPTPTQTSDPTPVPPAPPTHPPATAVPPDPPTATPIQDTTAPTILRVTSDVSKGYIFSEDCGPNYYPQQVTVTAEVTDDSEVASVMVGYELSGVGLFQVLMVGDGMYQATLGPFSVGDFLTYWVEATDAAGNRSQSDVSFLDIENCLLQ